MLKDLSIFKVWNQDTVVDVWNIKLIAARLVQRLNIFDGVVVAKYTLWWSWPSTIKVSLKYSIMKVIIKISVKNMEMFLFYDYKAYMVLLTGSQESETTDWFCLDRCSQ